MTEDETPGRPLTFARTAAWFPVFGDSEGPIVPVADSGLDRIAALAAGLLAAPAAQVSLIGAEQFVAGGAGLPEGVIGSRSPREHSLCTVTVGQSAPLVVEDARSDDRVRHLPPVSSGAVGAYLGVPLPVDGEGIAGALCVFGPLARSWSDDDVRLLDHLARFVASELELTAMARDRDDHRARWDLAAEGGGMGSYDWDLVTNDLVWDDRLIAIFGYDQGDVGFDRSIASVEARVHPDDASLVDDVISTCIATSGPLHVVYRIIRPDGEVRWLEARGHAVPGPDGPAVRLIGVTWDVTDDHDNEARAERILASMTVGYLALDPDWRVRFVNAEGSRLLGREVMDLLGLSLWDLFPDAVGSPFEEAYRRVRRTGRAETLEAYYPAPLNAWYEVRAVPESGGVALYFLDITERRHSLDLLRVSVDFSEQTVGAVSVDAAVAALAKLVVPILADWSIVTLVEPDGRMRDVQSWHAEPALRPVVDRYARNRLEGGGSGVIQRAIRTGAPVVVASGVTEFGVRVLSSQQAREDIETLKPESAVTMPMLSGATVVGVLTLCRGADRPVADEHELGVAESLCRRAGLVVDNARLYAAEARAAARDRTVAQALQQALLTTLPDPPDLRLAARYRTAEDGDQVGGDWYDAVLQPGGATVLMIGDVVGHDIGAAATMGQLRTMLRMLALEHESPAAILAGLDRAAEALRLDALATVLVARLEPAAADSRARVVRWSNAGHPPPVVLCSDGSTARLASDDHDLMMGVQADSPRSEHRVRLAPGSTLLLYTDGLVERRGDDLDDGIALLEDAGRRHHDPDPQVLLDRLLGERLADRPYDDVAVLAVHLPL